MKVDHLSVIFLLLYIIGSKDAYSKGNIPLHNKKATLINTFETKHCFISYVKIGAHVYIVKQKKAENKQIAAVRDTLAAHLIRKLDIAHVVDIISFKKKFPGKIHNGWPATIHTIAPGDTVRKQPNSIYSKLRLRQLWALAKNFEQMGITRDMITQITWHRQLPIIMAIDLVIGNSDRHCGNLCYDPQTDTFCAIDMDDTFNKDLCLIACKKFEIMLKDNKNVFSVEEVRALALLRKTIKQLLDTFSSSDVVKKLHYFAHKAGFAPGTPIYTPSIVKKLTLYESVITQSWRSARQLVGLLNKVINKNIRYNWYVKDNVSDDASVYVA